ncbi:hypothetical protein HPULCUR_006614 [Helicostylum pulchrum]|uniref:EF-hand domain-containing protein n=1 Tax=Helicostylum pulchrum TaxID=562976 RepID=A0ABP9Y2G4_9FUNG
MGQAKSRETQENNLLSKKTHFSKKEIHDLRHKVDSKTNITPQVFKELYSAFNSDSKKGMDFSEFVDGLSIFIKGNSEEKLTLSFKLYDVNHDGFLTKTELERVMLKLSCTFSKDDRTAEIKEMVEHMFKDFDVDNDGRLSFEEYKLSAMKEPLIVDFLEQFLSEHHISGYTRTTSRAESIRSRVSTRSPSSSRLSVRLSQAELLDYSHHKRLSRPTSMTSLDAALTSMEVGSTLSNITK